MPSPNHSQLVAPYSRFDSQDSAEDAYRALLEFYRRLAARIRAWISVARERPHDVMAMAVLSSIGAYFSFVGYLLVLSGPGE